MNKYWWAFEAIPPSLVSKSNWELLLQMEESRMRTADSETCEKLANNNINRCLDVWSSQSNRTMRDFQASNRHVILSRLHERHPLNIRFLLLLAESHLFLSDKNGTLLLLEEARDLMRKEGISQDDNLESTIANLNLWALDDELEYVEKESDADIQVFNYQRVPHCPQHLDPSDLIQKIKEKWSLLSLESTQVDHFVGYACIASIEIEGVFQLNEKLRRKLAQQNSSVFVDSNQGISFTNQVRNPSKIQRMIQNTLECYSILANRSTDLCSDLVMDIHRRLTKEENNGCERMLTTQNRNRYRPLSHYTKLSKNSQDEKWFCPVNQIEEEMEWYFDQARSIIVNKSIDPYIAAAWLYHSLAQIHPFADGSGRLSILIASIPLLKNGLPPVCVAPESKDRFWTLIKNVDQNIDCLAQFFREESFEAVNNLLSFRRTTCGDVGLSFGDQSLKIPRPTMVRQETRGERTVGRRMMNGDYRDPSSLGAG
jgi:prophage maintenance system killer protein